MTFSELFKSYTTASGLTYSEIARQAGVARQTIARIAVGEYVPTKPETISKLAEITGAPEDDYFRAAGRIPPDIHDWLLSNETAIAQVRSMKENT